MPPPGGATGIGPAETANAEPAEIPAGAVDSETSVYTPPARLAEPPSKPPAKQRKKLWTALGGAAGFVLIAGLAISGATYLSSRYPNDAEKALLRQVPLDMRGSCTRNEAVQEGSANVEASLMR